MKYKHSDCPGTQQKFQQWMRKNQIVKEVAVNAPKWVKLTHNYYRFFPSETREESFLDHTMLYENVDRERIFIAQPDVDFDIEPDDKRIADWVEERGLSFRVSKDESFHCPGYTVLLEFRIVDYDRYDDFLQKIRII